MAALRIILTFYKSFAIASLLISAACGSILLSAGLKSFVAIFWFKVLTSFLVYLYINTYKSSELYYYHNLGFSKRKLWVSSLLIDFLVFISIISSIIII
ncbi:MAG: hypothetical protein K9G76_10735 [Bacteroidales bacterium]|nr:hypothetical protein [Bacteroidales bacterium]MCF8404245.1 hypothetical protein [Bacteroidales bacterium]